MSRGVKRRRCALCGGGRLGLGEIGGLHFVGLAILSIGDSHELGVGAILGLCERGLVQLLVEKRDAPPCRP